MPFGRPPFELGGEVATEIGGGEEASLGGDGGGEASLAGDVGGEASLWGDGGGEALLGGDRVWEDSVKGYSVGGGCVCGDLREDVTCFINFLG